MVAQRVRDVEESSTVKSASMVADLRARGVEVMSLAMGEPDFKTPDNITEAAISALRNGRTHYTQAEGIPELREAVADKCRRENGIDCSQEDVLISSSKFALFSAMFSLLDGGDVAFVPDPGWQSYEACATLCGAKVEVYNSIRKDLTGVREAIKNVERSGKKVRLFVLNTPSNPAGILWEENEIRELADLAEEMGFYVLSDEVYEKLIYEGLHFSIGRFLGDHCITVNGFSKTYAMTGWRIGYAVAHGDVFDSMKKVVQHTQTCATSFAQYGALEAIRGPQKAVKEMKREFRRRRDIAFKRLKKIDGIELELPHGAFYLFPSYGYGMNSETFCDRVLAGTGVLLTPGSVFGANGENHFRLSYATENLERALDAIETYLYKLNHIE